MNQKDKQLIQYKYELEDLFFSGKYSGEVADLIKHQILEVGKKITPTKIIMVDGHPTLDNDYYTN